MSEKSQDTLLEFPCRFPLKVMGDKHEEFVPVVIEEVRVHAPDFDAELDLMMRESSSGRYMSLTLTVNATSKEQLDNLYRSLSGHPLVKVVL
ncbi:MAG: YbeD family protein [Microvirgula sp.]